MESWTKEQKIAAGIGAGLVVVILVLFLFINPQKGANEVLPPPSSETPSAPVSKENQQAWGEFDFVKATPLELEPVGSNIECSQGDEIKINLGDNQDHFWQGPEAGTFIFYEDSTRTLAVCDQGVLTTAKLPRELGNLTKDEEMVRVSTANFRDLNGDGKKEFILFNGQCVEGPCIGDNFIYQVDGQKIRRLYTIRSDDLEVAPDAFFLTTNCYTYEFGIGLKYVAVAQFATPTEFKTVPALELNKRFPKALATLRPIANALPAETPEEKAIQNIQQLILQAYLGEPPAKLMKSYEDVLNSLPKTDGEVSPETRLPLHCSPKQILEMISSNH